MLHAVPQSKLYRKTDIIIAFLLQFQLRFSAVDDDNEEGEEEAFL